MFTINNKKINNMCNVCLNTERKLSILKDSLDLFMKISYNLKPSYQTRNLLLCWECQSLLKKVQKFQEKVMRAQDFFENISNSLNVLHINEGFQSFSTLTSVTKSDYDYHYNFVSCEFNKENTKNANDVKHEDEESQENKLFKINNEIKNENDEFDYYQEFDNFEKLETDDELSDIKIEYGAETSFNFGNNLRKRKKKNIECESDAQLVNDASDNISNSTPLKKKKKNISSLKWDKLNNLIPMSINKLDINKTNEIGDVIKTKRAKQQNPYKVIQVSKRINTKTFKRIDINEEELQLWHEKERATLKNAEYKCNGCITDFIKEKSYIIHMAKFHSEQAGPYECNICNRRYKTKQKLKTHHDLHYFKHKCSLCKKEFYKHHLHKCRPGKPPKIYECYTCGLQFDTLKLFFNHYKLHTTFICDYCGKTTTTKNALLSHMSHTHLPIHCKICKVTYKHYRFLVQHMKERHVVDATEDTYCVECNIQFENMYRFKKHLRTSVKHVPPKKQRFPCKECGKTFAKITAANNHYNYIHKKETKFICEPCNRFFLNGFRLRQHQASVHMNIRPLKNKLCGYCGRAFSANRILENHIRTHTGERPFKCSHCPAAFSQKQALTTHTRAIHKICNK